MIHFTPKFFTNPADPITIAVIGAGATGSQVVTQLARINEVLQQLGHRGIHVSLYDNDIINEHNVGKQMFARSEIGLFKAESIMNRINRFYSTAWNAYNQKVLVSKVPATNIIITCVDSAKFRLNLKVKFAKQRDKNFKGTNYNVPTFKQRNYWIDIGNENDFGQIFMSTTCEIKQLNKSGIKKLYSAQEIFPNAKIDTSKDQVSCSMAESLQKQDLFINSILAQYAGHMIWQLLNKPCLDYQGIFVNLKNFNITKFPIYEPKQSAGKKKTDTNRKAAPGVGRRVR